MREKNYIGIMTGTSTDAADGVLASFNHQGKPMVLAQKTVDLPLSLKEELLALNAPGFNELERAHLVSLELANIYSEVVHLLLEEAQMDASQIAAVGVHGQTVRHRPDLGFTVQLNAPAALAQKIGIAVIADFRSRDVAAGGQGAPLAPLFHQAFLGHHAPLALLNLGGIANLSLLLDSGSSLGFDTGPANVLMDAWCLLNWQEAYDREGMRAKQGQLSKPLLNFLIDNEPWFTLPPPKSTGRDLFNPEWLYKRLRDFAAQDGHIKLSPEDILCTLVHLSAKTIVQSLLSVQKSVRTLVVSGGGAKNPVFIQIIRDYLREAGVAIEVCISDDYGIAVDAMEALGFAWLAWAHEQKIPLPTPRITGACQDVILGAYYPA